MKLQERISTKYQPIYDDSGTYGVRIGTIGKGTEVIVDMDRAKKDHKDRLFSPIVGPRDTKLGPTWKVSGKQGWIEIANTSLVSGETTDYILQIEKGSGIAKLTRI